MRNVRRAEGYEGLFQRFTEKAHPISNRPIFTTQRDFLCFLAVLGFHAGERLPLTGKTIELDGRVFETNEQARDLVYLIALAGSKDAGILQPDREDELVQVFEEFVAAGFKVLNKWMVMCPDDHIGDQAILTALRRDGFFGTQTSSLKKALENIQF
jgi:dnd system-associated protein 4